MYAAHETNSHIFHRLGLVAAMATIGWSFTVSAAVPLTSAFTYQGHVLDAGEPITGLVDLQCTLFDDDVAGTAIARPIEVLDVAVVEGIFTAQLDFGDDAFDGNQRWLEIAVRSPAGVGGYTTLSPRQHLARIFHDRL